MKCAARDRGRQLAARVTSIGLGQDCYQKLSNMRGAQTRRDSPTRLTAVTYAATATLILLGLASSRSGSRTVSTPALYWALTLPASTVGGSANVRANEP
jgi:hypothetical protein